MKSYTVALTLLILGFAYKTGHGQTAEPEKFFLSLDAGFNISTLPGLARHHALPGINIGIGAFIRLSEKWSLTPELKTISTRGASDVFSITSDVTLGNPRFDIRTNYVDLPILFQFAVSERISIAAGPQLSFLTSAYQSATGNSLTTGKSVTVISDIKSLMHKESFMVPVQVSYALFSRGRKCAYLKARYNIGIMEAFTATSIATSTNSTFQFIVGFPVIHRRSLPK